MMNDEPGEHRSPNPRYQQTRSGCAVEGVGAMHRGEALKER